MKFARSNGFTLVELLVAVGIIAVLVGLLMPTMAKTREQANRVKCATNLRALGQALRVYVEENRHYPATYQLPWEECHAKMHGSWANNRGADLTVPGANCDPFTLNETFPATPVWANNVTASLFLLLRYHLATPEQFICPSTLAQPDRFAGRDVSTRGNFTGDGPEPTGSVKSNCSYGYSSPFRTGLTGRDFMGDRMKSGFALMADMGPGYRKDQSHPWWTRNVNDSPSRQQYMNSYNHKRQGQNVLYVDGHVDFATTVFVGINKNSIYVGDTEVGTYDSDPNIRAWSLDDDKIGMHTPTHVKDEYPLSADDSLIVPWEYD